MRFAALPDGSLLTDGDVDADLTPLARGVERELAPPYRAHAVRGERGWAVAAEAIDVVELQEEVAGDELELTVSGGERMLVVDGRPAFGALRELERLGEERGDDYVLRATRLDGDLWEVEVSPL